MAAADPNESGIALKAIEPSTGDSVLIDDDGRVAYAYFERNGRYVSDVWLYNTAATPDEPEWNDRTKLPFLNPAEFASRESFVPIGNSQEVRVVWLREPNGETNGADIYIRGKLHARVVAGIKPGWSRLAIKDGPLAKVLRD